MYKTSQVTMQPGYYEKRLLSMANPEGTHPDGVVSDHFLSRRR